MTDEEDAWRLRGLNLAHEYSLRCKELRETNPYDFPAISNIARDLLTELWDQGFSVSEIKAGFGLAISELPQYAAGEDRRGDKDRL